MVDVPRLAAKGALHRGRQSSGVPADGPAKMAEQDCAHDFGARTDWPCSSTRPGRKKRTNDCSTRGSCAARIRRSTPLRARAARPRHCRRSPSDWAARCPENLRFCNEYGIFWIIADQGRACDARLVTFRCSGATKTRAGDRNGRSSPSRRTRRSLSDESLRRPSRAPASVSDTKGNSDPCQE